MEKKGGKWEKGLGMTINDWALSQQAVEEDRAGNGLGGKWARGPGYSGPLSRDSQL